MIVNRKTIGQPREPEIPPDELEALVEARMRALQGLEQPAEEPLPAEGVALPSAP